MKLTIGFTPLYWRLLLLLLLLLSCFSRVQLCATPKTAAHQAPPCLGFSRQEHWSGLPFPSPMHDSEKWKWSHSVMSDPQQPHELQPTRLLHPWDFPGKSTGVGCHCLLLSFLITCKPTFSCLHSQICWGWHIISFNYLLLLSELINGTTLRVLETSSAPKFSFLRWYLRVGILLLKFHSL